MYKKREGLVTEITSDKICSDGYDVSNLISSDEGVRKRGFLTGNFIRPPVTIKIKFICDINIHKIVIHSGVGRQKSSGFQLSTSRDGCEETRVGTGILDNDENVLEFSIHGKSKNKKSISFSLSKYMNKIRNVTVKIFKTQDSTLASLGKLEIWGSVNKITGNDVIKKVHQIWENIINPKHEKIIYKKLTNDQNTQKTPIFRYTKPKPKVKIPDEFLDPITWELMTIPMTLPSGNIVDATTLDRFHEAEKQHGRVKSDPFTGVAFTEINKPIVAVSLKARMDKFLLENDFDPDIEKAPRALGKKVIVQENQINIPGPSHGQKRTFDEVLSSCLSGLPSFTKSPAKKLKIECGLCKSDRILFKLTCEHLVCRSCLSDLKTNDALCPSCFIKIDFNKINRHHISTYF